MNTALDRMTAAGFRLEARGDRLRVAPADRLTEQQTRFIAEHKTELIAELHRRAIDHPTVKAALAAFPGAEIVDIRTRMGVAEERKQA